MDSRNGLLHLWASFERKRIHQNFHQWRLDAFSIPHYVIKMETSWCTARQNSGLDNAPFCGVAQGVFHGVACPSWWESGRGGRRSGERSRRGQGRENNQNTSAHVHGWDEMTRHGRGPWANVRCEQMCNASKNGAQCAQCCAVNSSVCVVSFTQLLVTLVSMLLRMCMKLYTLFRSLFCHVNMFVNFWFRMYCIYTSRLWQ